MCKEFSCDFLEGIITLLAKKGDQMLLTNKRPISLLTMKYKINAKAFELRIILALIKIISTQHYAYFPGRSIHQTLLLMNEMVYEVLAFGIPHACLKEV